MEKENISGIVVISDELVRNKIHLIRGQKVMLDFDLAEIYGYSTKDFNRQVKHNIGRFEEDFMFRLTAEEYGDLRRKNSTSSWGGTRYPPYAFTEQGVYMLMTVLRGELAVRQSKELIRTFKRMKDYILDTQGTIGQAELTRLALQTNENTQAIRRLEATAATKDDLHSFMTNFYDEHLGKELLLMDGQIVEAAVAYETIYSMAKKSICIVDNYIGLKTLLPLKRTRKQIEVIIFSDNLGVSLKKSEREEFQKEYPQVQLSFRKTCGKVHDRFIILDYGIKSEAVFLCGGSSKDAGTRVTAISKMKDATLISSLMEDLMGNPKLVLV